MLSAAGPVTSAFPNTGHNQVLRKTDKNTTNANPQVLRYHSMQKQKQKDWNDVESHHHSVIAMPDSRSNRLAVVAGHLTPSRVSSYEQIHGNVPEHLPNWTEASSVRGSSLTEVKYYKAQDEAIVKVTKPHHQN